MATLKKSLKYGGVTLNLILEAPEGTPLEWPDELRPLLAGDSLAEDLVSSTEYAKLNGKAPKSVRDLIHRGRLKTAVKIGRNWLVNRNEPYPNRRVKTRKCEKS